MRLVLVSILLGLMYALDYLLQGSSNSLFEQRSLIFGFLLLAGFVFGEFIAKLSLPRITGYLLMGMLLGPHFLGTVSTQIVEQLRWIDELALCLIAFTAGTELQIDSLKKRMKGLISITLGQLVIVFGGVTCCYVLVLTVFPFDFITSESQIVAVAAILGFIATASSPATAVAVIVETHAKGPTTDTILGVTILKDIAVLVGFAALMALVYPIFISSTSGSNASNHTELGHVLLSVFLSLLLGVVVGFLLIIYLRFINKHVMLFIIAFAFVIVRMSHYYHLDTLLLAVMAGFIVANFSSHGHQLNQNLELAFSPIGLIFFCLAGASLDVKIVVSLWYMVLLFIVVRIFFTFAATKLGAFLAKEALVVKQYAWWGYIGQAGVSLGLATILRKSLPGVGGSIADLIIGAIVINQIIGPIMLRTALIKCKESQNVN